MKFESVTIQMKATVVLFIMLYKVLLTFECMLACSRLRDSGERNQCEADVEKN